MPRRPSSEKGEKRPIKVTGAAGSRAPDDNDPLSPSLRRKAAVVARNRGERLRAARMKRFRSARSAAIALAIPISTYGAHERAESPGGRDYGPDEARRYARHFGVTPEWLLTGHREPADESANVPEALKSFATKLRIIGYVGTDAQAHLYAVVPQDLEEIAVPILATESTVALEIRGNSIGSYFNHWLILYDDLRQPVTSDLIGQLCIVALKDGRVVVKQLQQGGTQGQFDLISEAGSAIRDAGIAWAAKVEAMLPR